MIDVLICDDQEVVRKGLNIILKHAEGIRVVALAADGREAIELADRHRPHVVCMDLKMPKMDGVAATREISRRLPDSRVLVLTTYADDASLFDAIRAGASGYLLKDAPAAEIVQAIRDTAAGHNHIDPAIAGTLLSAFRTTPTSRRQGTPDAPFEPLTDRELSILELMAEGKTNGEIAASLHLAVGTVKNNVSVIMRKLRASDRTQAVLTALRHGIVDL